MSNEVKKGDTPHSTEVPSGGHRPIPNDPNYTPRMVLAEVIMQDDREVLRALAK